MCYVLYRVLFELFQTIETALEVGEIVAVETNEVMAVSVESSSVHPKRRGILAGMKKIPVVDENVEPNSQVHPELPKRTHCVQAIVENVSRKESSIPSTDKNSLMSTNMDNNANVVASKENALAFKDFTCARVTNCKQTTLFNKGNFIACNVNMSKNNALSKESTGNFRKENAASVNKENFAMASNRSPIPRMKIVSTKDKKIKEIVTLANRPAEIPSVTNRPFQIPPVTNNPVKNRPLPTQPVTKSLFVSTNVDDSEQMGMKCFEDAIKSNPAMSSTPIKRCRIEESENGQHPLAPPAKKYNPIMFSTPIKQFNIEESVKGPHPPAPPAKKSNPIMSSTPIKRLRMEESAKDQHPLAPPAKKSNLRMRFKPYVEEFSVDDDEEVVLSRDAYAKLGGQLPEPLRPRVAYQFSGTQIRPQAVLVASKLRQPMVPMKTARLASLKDSKVKKLPEKSSQGRVTHSQQSEVIARPISNLVTTKEIAKETSSHNKQDDANRNTMSRHLPNVVEQNVGHLSNGGCKIEFSPSHSQENVNPNVPTTGVKQEQSNMDARPEVATDGDSVALLLELQRKLMSLTDRDILQQVVQIIEGTGKYRLNKSTFDFDLCKLDRATVKQLHVCLS